MGIQIRFKYLRVMYATLKFRQCTCGQISLENSFSLYYIKETYTVCSGISFYNVNQKPMSLRTNFHRVTTKSACPSERNSVIYLHIM